jgi:hypothetical protein
MAQDQRFEYSDSSLMEDPSETKEYVIEPEKAAEPDTMLYSRLIIIPNDSLRAWKTNPSFKYMRNLDSMLKAYQESMKKKNQSDYGSSSVPRYNPFSSVFVQTILWILAGATVLFILYRLFLSNGLFIRNREAKTVQEITEEQHVADVQDFDALVKQSYRQGDYRMAVRWLFLKTIRQLGDKGLLQPSPDKTNYQYVQQIEAGKKNEFASLVLHYEYVWFGHVSISREQYEQVEQRFQVFFNKI